MTHTDRIMALAGRTDALGKIVTEAWMTECECGHQYDANETASFLHSAKGWTDCHGTGQVPITYGDSDLDQAAMAGRLARVADSHSRYDNHTAMSELVLTCFDAIAVEEPMDYLLTYLEGVEVPT